MPSGDATFPSDKISTPGSALAVGVRRSGPLRAVESDTGGSCCSQSARIMGLRVAALTEHDAVQNVIGSALEDAGTWMITANLDHLRRYHCEPLARRLLDSADAVVADGAPLVWASRIAGTPLPERVAGADLVWSVSAAADRAGVPIFLLGGNPGVADASARILRAHFPGLDICGTLCPPLGFERDVDEMARIELAVKRAQPGVVMVALGFPKQDILIERLRLALPGVSFIGIGISLSFVCGDEPRSPAWTQAAGLEWVHRLIHEPTRLARRYVIRGIPFAARLLCSAAKHRVFSSLRSQVNDSPWGWELGR